MVRSCIEIITMIPNFVDWLWWSVKKLWAEKIEARVLRRRALSPDVRSLEENWYLICCGESYSYKKLILSCLVMPERKSSQGECIRLNIFIFVLCVCNDICCHQLCIIIITIIIIIIESFLQPGIQGRYCRMGSRFNQCFSFLRPSSGLHQ